MRNARLSSNQRKSLIITVINVLIFLKKSGTKFSLSKLLDATKDTNFIAIDQRDHAPTVRNKSVTRLCVPSVKRDIATAAGLFLAVRRNVRLVMN